MITPISQRGQRLSFDVLVIGSGLAGLIYTLELSQLKPDAQIALITKKTLNESNSFYAQGGIAAATENNDSLEKHVVDTLSAGDGLSNEDAVKKILQYGARAIQLLKNYGVHFDKTNYHDDLTREGGHSEHRIFHVEDNTGQVVIETLLKVLLQQENVQIFEHHTAVNLIEMSEKEVCGAYVLDENQNQIHVFLARAVVLGTGGAGKVYRYTSNPETATGDGIAMAYRAGARLGNLEFYQFHPTVLFHPQLNNFLITEALRGEGAYLLHPDTQERFMKHYDARRMELSTRDIVSRAIFNVTERSENKYVYLDIRHKKRSVLKKRFPCIFKTLLALGLDMSKDLIPVVPAAHFLCGGVVTNTAGQTDLKRLYVIGEAAWTGLHGSNRLASNALLECVMMGHFAAQDSLQWVEKPLKNLEHIEDWSSQTVIDTRRASQINAHWLGLRAEMNSYAGIVRTQAGLDDLLQLILVRKTMINDYYWTHEITRDLIELRNIVLMAELIVRSALRREESRGGHYREDFPVRSKDIFQTILHVNKIDPVFE